jgi:crotonobetainyl-CoA:carnitine CoA-transferase CaiB-like acyl-CoA transferase
MLGLAQALQLPLLAERGASMHPEDRAEIKQLVKNAIALEDFAHWQQVFAALDVCVEPVLTLSEAAQSELAQARGWVVDVPLDVQSDLAAGQTQVQLAHPIRFSRSQPVYRFVGRSLGADNALLATSC